MFVGMKSRVITLSGLLLPGEVKYQLNFSTLI